MRTETSHRLPPVALAFLLLLLPGALPAQLTPIGLSEVRGQWFEAWWDTTSPSLDYFALAVATGDFNGDGADDLATGVPGDETPWSSSPDYGSVVVRYGSPGFGLVGGVGTILREDEFFAWTGERFGSALAAGDFNHDLFEDLAVGIPHNEPGSRGAVRVYYGSATGLVTSGSELIEEVTTSEPGNVCDFASFGAALAAGDFNNDTFHDLAIGAPTGCEIIDGAPVAGGSVFVAEGHADGLMPFVGYRISQDSPGIFDQVDLLDEFGAALAAGDFDDDGYADLAIGVASENASGAIEIILGSQFGLIFADSIFWFPGALDEDAGFLDRFGHALASGDFDGDGVADLAIGTPFEDLEGDPTIVDAGVIHVAYGAPRPLIFDLSRTTRLFQGWIFGNANHDGAGDLFGFSLGAGDFDGDDYIDLAVGSSSDDWSGLDHGAVTVLMGVQLGLSFTGRYRLIGVGWEGIPGDAGQTGQHSGTALAVGDFDDDGFDDLVIGIPRYDRGAAAEAGAETVLYGALFADGFEIAVPDRWTGAQP